MVKLLRKISLKPQPWFLGELICYPNTKDMKKASKKGSKINRKIARLEKKKM